MGRGSVLRLLRQERIDDCDWEPQTNRLEAIRAWDGAPYLPLLHGANKSCPIRLRYAKYSKT
jgi:hypothetical protein